MQMLKWQNERNDSLLILFFVCYGIYPLCIGRKGTMINLRLFFIILLSTPLQSADVAPITLSLPADYAQKLCNRKQLCATLETNAETVFNYYSDTFEHVTAYFSHPGYLDFMLYDYGIEMVDKRVPSQLKDAITLSSLRPLIQTYTDVIEKKIIKKLFLISALLEHEKEYTPDNVSLAFKCRLEGISSIFSYFADSENRTFSLPEQIANHWLGMLIKNKHFLLVTMLTFFHNLYKAIFATESALNMSSNLRGAVRSTYRIFDIYDILAFKLALKQANKGDTMLPLRDTNGGYFFSSELTKEELEQFAACLNHFAQGNYAALARAIIALDFQRICVIAADEKELRERALLGADRTATLLKEKALKYCPLLKIIAKEYLHPTQDKHRLFLKKHEKTLNNLIAAEKRRQLLLTVQYFFQSLFYKSGMALE